MPNAEGMTAPHFNTYTVVNFGPGNGFKFVVGENIDGNIFYHTAMFYPGSLEQFITGLTSIKAQIDAKMKAISAAQGS